MYRLKSTETLKTEGCQGNTIDFGRILVDKAKLSVPGTFH